MKQKILRAFPYSPDGMKVVTLEAGAVADIRDDLVEGLRAASYVGDPDAADLFEGEAAPAAKPPRRARKAD